MSLLRYAPSRAILILSLMLSLMLTLGLGQTSFAQAQEQAQGRAPALPPSLISLAEARAIIEGTIALAQEKNARLGVVVLDETGEFLAGEHMDGAPGRNIQFAEGKAFAAVMYRTTSAAMSDLYKSAPARYFGIMNTYGSKIYLVGGGIPLAVDGKLVGAVGVAGTNQDDLFAQAGIAAWEKVRASLRK